MEENKHDNSLHFDRPAGLPQMQTNDLTQAIIKYLRFHGHYAVRVNTFGMFNRKTSSYRRSTTDRGTADIHACIDGRHVSIEVKSGSDRLSKQQKTVQEQVQNADGICLIISDFYGFHHWYKTVIKNGRTG
ncbi:hypothetical protein [Arsenicibacter rosenii]|uniref:VRR-NUC domain-containing protein n=1 Tax=Arsenicibacter rosenii TaxID=1750698 RepID=A0A1S2VFS2_9BACT|nr:hypothetical protein [Arsenicibacter rosenii]OIN57270.1 hypothetical protein BLX24_20005 [Arsenicibacter rosenii]